ncbi:hypothetical protein SteCoe_23019 [Stentor coeruleus]|uniref:Glycosyl hydrolases family 2 sugar binding domain-containing protein n=1 Tax=Stentor coeruleus TaxID=5963 RepID=A0A1R2BKV5_9CILI|nr:hypothetical protein SteCoe_23019 [Stentor coeruleus]
MISVFLVLLITLFYSQSCFSPTQIDFTSYVTSGTYDWLVSDNYPYGTWASLTSNTEGLISIPEAPFIWDSSDCVCTITITRPFFLPVIPSKVDLYILVDDYAIVNINGKCSYYVPGGITVLFDMTSYAQLGLNELKIVATNLYGPGGLAYKLIAFSKLV